MSVRSSIKQSKIRQLYRLSLTATAPANTLLAQIEAYNDAMIAAGGTGQTIASTSSNGLSVAFEKGEGLNPSSAIDLANELQNAYDAAKVDLTADGDVSQTDAEILARMIIILQPQYSRSSNFSTVSSY